MLIILNSTFNGKYMYLHAHSLYRTGTPGWTDTRLDRAVIKCN